MNADYIRKIFNKEVAENYDTFYDNPLGTEIDEIEKKVTASMLREVPRGPLLEIGCGTGHWTMFFSSLGFEVTATDISADMLKVASGRDSRGVVFREADAEDLPFPDGSFPLIAAVSVFEFVQDPERALGEIRRVLRPGGRFLGGFLNAESELGKRKDTDPVLRHGRLFTKKRLKELLAPLGEVTIEECVYISPDLKILDSKPDFKICQPAYFSVLVEKVS